MPINLSGMASGLDTESIVSQLMALEQNKVTAVQRRQIGVQQHKDDLGAIKTKLDALKIGGQRAQRHRDLEATQTTTSSDPTKVDVTLLGGAGIGGHSIQVDKLASSAQHGFTYAPSATAGSLTLHYGTGPADAAPATARSRSRRRQRDRRRRGHGDQRQRGLARVRRRDQGERRRRARRSSPPRKTGEKSNFTVDTSAMGAGNSLTEDPAYERIGDASSTRSYTLDGEALGRASPRPTSSRTRSPACG